MAYEPNNPNGQAVMANSSPVVIASDQSPVPVTGIIAGTVAVSNFPATQPVSAVSLPLPTGAATEATLGLVALEDGGNLQAIAVATASIDAKTMDSGQAAMAQSSPVVIASDQTPIPVTGTVSTGGLTDTELRATPVPVSLSSDIEIGAVEIKDATTGTRVNVVNDGVNDAMVVKQNSQPLPTGASTSALQSTINTTLGSPFQAGGSIGNTAFGVNNGAGASAVNIQDGGNSITVDGTVGVSGSVAVTGPLTDAELRATPVPVSGTVSATVSGTVAVSNFPATQPISAASLPLPTGAATAALQTQPGVDIGDVTVNNGAGASAVNIQDGGNSITVDGTVAISGSVAVTGPLTDAQLRATAVPVSGTVAATQSGTWNINNISGTVSLPTGASTAALQTTQLTFPDYHDAVAQGVVAGSFAVTISGRNPDVDTAVEEDVWGTGGTWIPIVTARTLSFASTSASDTNAAGVGARKVLVTGLNGSYVRTTETINLNGVTPVVTSGTWLFMESAEVVDSGSTMWNVGDITATATTEATIQGKILATISISQISFFQVPAGYTGYVHSFFGESSNTVAGTTCNVSFNYQVFGTNTWVRPVIFRSRPDGNPQFNLDLNFPYPLPEKSRIKFVASSDTNNSVVDVLYQVQLKAN